MKNILARGGIEFLAVLLGITGSLYIDNNNKVRELDDQRAEVYSLLKKQIEDLREYSDERLREAWQSGQSGRSSIKNISTLEGLTEALFIDASILTITVSSSISTLGHVQNTVFAPIICNAAPTNKVSVWVLFVLIYPYSKSSESNENWTGISFND